VDVNVPEVSMDRIRIGYPAGYLQIFLDQDWIWIFIFEKKFDQDRIRIFV